MFVEFCVKYIIKKKKKKKNSNLEIGFGEMTIGGFVSAANLSCQSTLTGNQTLRCGFLNNSVKTNALAFGGCESMGHSLRIPHTKSIRLRPRKGVSPLQVRFVIWRFGFKILLTKLPEKISYLLMMQVVCMDFPRPELENTVNFLEAAYLSSSLRASARPSKPLTVVIAGAGEEYIYLDIFFLTL